jgi:hypothetical protein
LACAARESQSVSSCRPRQLRSAAVNAFRPETANHWEMWFGRAAIKQRFVCFCREVESFEQNVIHGSVALRIFMVSLNVYIPLLSSLSMNLKKLFDLFPLYFLPSLLFS